MKRLILIIISALALASSPAFAKEGGAAVWIVSQLSGDARVVHAGLQPAALKVRARLEPGDMVLTGATGRATLTRGADYIIVAPRSELRLPSVPQANGFTRVIQNLGTLLFKVKHTGVPHFAVDTPMLAAVVKGTTFTVVVGKDRSAVQVIEGAVQVTAADGGMSRLVEGGKTVFIDRATPKLLIDADERSPTATGSSSTAVRLNGSQTPSLVALANLTGGLVHAGAPTPAAPAAGSTAGAPALPTQPVVSIADATLPPGAGDAVVDVGDATTDTVSDVTDTVSDVVDSTTDTITDVVDTTTDTVDVADTVDVTTDTVVDVVDTTTDTVVDVVDTVVDIADNSGPGNDVIDTVTDTVADVVDTTADVVDTTVTAVTGTTTDVIGGVLGGLFPR